MICSGRLICDLGGVVVFIVEKNKRGRRNEGEREKDHSSCHKLNITDGFNRRI
jgi:hypothetical protein